MQLLTHTVYHYVQSFTEFLRLPKIDLLMRRVIVWMLIVNIVLGAGMYARYFIFNQQQADVAYADTTQDVVKKPVEVGAATKLFVQSLKSSNIVPIIGSQVKRKQFTVDGRSVIISGDNFQVFEYQDSETAMNEAKQAAQKYISRSNVHIYVNNKLTTFYLGKNPTMIKLLNQNAGLSVMNPTKTVSVVVK